MTNPHIVHGTVINEETGRKDSLIRVTLKAVILNEKGETLVVKENGRDWWDTPGGGIDHGETIKEALGRELLEEVTMQGDFEYETLLAEDPHYMQAHNLYQMRITFLVKPKTPVFSAGADGDEIKFVDTDLYEHSELWTERQIYLHSQIAKARLKSSSN